MSKVIKGELYVRVRSPFDGLVVKSLQETDYDIFQAEVVSIPNDGVSYHVGEIVNLRVDRFKHFPRPKNMFKDLDEKVNLTDNGTKLQISEPHKQITETKRRDFWCRVVVSIAGSANCVKSDTPIVWADKYLAAFDERFKNK